VIVRTKTENSSESIVFKIASRSAIVLMLLFLSGGLSVYLIGIENIKSYLREDLSLRTRIKSLGVNALDRSRPISEVIKIGLDNFPENLYQPNNFPKLTLDLKFKEFEKLRTNREVSLNLGMIKTENLDWAKGTLNFGGQKFRAKMRLKGDLMDHIILDKWSLRIKIRKDQSLNGMTEFSIQAPVTRDFHTESLLHYVMRAKNIITLRNLFVDLQVNGRSIGNMYIEEHFVEALTEYSRRPFGPIFKTEGWGMPLRSIQPISFYDKDLFWEDDANFLTAMAALSAISRGEVDVEGFFDKDKWATYFANTFVFECYHGNMDPNLRFYFHPLNKVFEPVNYDNSCGQTGNGRIGELMPVEGELAYLILKDDEIRSKVKDELLWWRDSPGATDLLKNVKYLEEELRSSLLKEAPFLAKISVDRDYVDELIDWLDVFETTPEKFNYFDRKNNLIDFFSPDTLILGEDLVPFRGATFYLVKKDGNFLVELESVIQQSIHLSEMLVKNEDNTLKIDLSKVIPLFEGSAQLYPLEGLLSDALEGADLSISYYIEGNEPLLTKEIMLGVISDAKLPYDETPTSILDKYFEIEHVEKILSIPSNQSLIVSDNLVLPRGYSLNISSGVDIKFSQDVGLIARGPVQIIGTSNAPVTLDSVGDFWGGFVILADGADVRLEHLNLSNASGQNIGGHNFKGAMSIVEGNSRILNSSFGYNLSEDALNIVQGVAYIDGLTIFNTHSDGLDVDFGNITLLNSTFKNIGDQPGADAVDVSGTKIYIQDLEIDNSTDKGISIGEGSNAKVNNLIVSNALVAIAAKDSSIVDVDGLITKEIGMADIMTYQKKAQFKGAVVKATSLTLTRPRFLNQNGSAITLDGKSLTSTALNVEKMYNTIMQSNKKIIQLPGTSDAS
jgi:hypothetical protein